MMQGYKVNEINIANEEMKKYIKNLPDSLKDKIAIVNGNLAYDINKTSKEEQLILKSNYGFKVVGDTIAPYASSEKKIENGKVRISGFIDIQEMLQTQDYFIEMQFTELQVREVQHMKLIKMEHIHL